MAHTRDTKGVSYMSRQANVTTTEATEEVKKLNIAASVSQMFQDAVRKAAKDANYTVSTWLSYHIEQALGRNPDKPDTDADSENVTISTAVPQDIKDAIKAALSESQSQADYIRTVAAKAAGYDLSQEPERLPSGLALAQYKERVANKDAMLMEIWEEDPEMCARVLIRRKQSWAAIGFKPEIVQAALKAGTLSQDTYALVEATAATATPEATPEPVAAS